MKPQQTPSTEPVSSSSSSSSSAAASSSVPELRQAATAVSSSDDAPPNQGGPGGSESVVVERRGEHSAVCRWMVPQFPRTKARALWSRYFEVGGYDCRLLIYPKGDSQALPGYLSIYLQIVDPRGSSSSKWDCFASYRLAVVHPSDDSKSIARDSWHRFSSKKKSHGWCDFTPAAAILDPKAGFLHSPSDAVLVTADILILHESVAFSRDHELQAPPAAADVLSGKFTWKVHNFSLFREMIKTQKIMSPVFPAGDCNLRISVYQSSVAGVEYLSMCLESKDMEKIQLVPERNCWCLFRMSMLKVLQRYARTLGSKDSDAHKPAVIGDIIGDPLKDTSGPSLNILIKLMAVASLVFAPIFPTQPTDLHVLLIHGKKELFTPQNGANGRTYHAWSAFHFFSARPALRRETPTSALPACPHPCCPHARAHSSANVST